MLKTCDAAGNGTTSKLKGKTVRKIKTTARSNTCRIIETPCRRRYLSSTIKTPLPSIDTMSAIFKTGKTALNSGGEEGLSHPLAHSFYYLVVIVGKIPVEEVEKDQKKEAPYDGDVVGDKPLKPCTLEVIVHPRSHLPYPGDCFV